MNGLDNAVIMEVLSWKIKFTINERILSRKSSPKYYSLKTYSNNVGYFLMQPCLKDYKRGIRRLESNYLT